MKKNVLSFTLIEMMVVVAIIGILVGIGIMYMGNYERKQNDDRRKQDITSIANALEQFKADHGHYPFINWHPGVHAYQVLGGTIANCNNGNPDEEANTTGTNIKYISANVDDPDNFKPGTEIKYDMAGDYCDDLSLQLTGKAYLPKMPANEGVNPGWIVDPNNSKLKQYMTEVPKDPLIIKNDVRIRTVCDKKCPTTWDVKATADYDRNPSHPLNVLFRYFYNSYYQCSPEGVNLGDQYNISAIVQLKSNGIYDDPGTPPDPNITGCYFYEVGSINFYRKPKSICGG